MELEGVSWEHRGRGREEKVREKLLGREAVWTSAQSRNAVGLVCGLTTWVLPERVGQAPSDIAERSIDSVGKQWASGFEAVKGVKTGCETDDPHLGWITLVFYGVGTALLHVRFGLVGRPWQAGSRWEASCNGSDGTVKTQLRNTKT